MHPRAGGGAGSKPGEWDVPKDSAEGTEFHLQIAEAKEAIGDLESRLAELDAHADSQEVAAEEVEEILARMTRSLESTDRALAYLSETSASRIEQLRVDHEQQFIEVRQEVARLRVQVEYGKPAERSWIVATGRAIARICIATIAGGGAGAVFAVAVHAEPFLKVAEAALGGAAGGVASEVGNRATKSREPGAPAQTCLNYRPEDSGSPTSG